MNYLVYYGGGEGPDVWDNETQISAVDMLDAARQAAGIAEETGGFIISINQEDYDDPVSVRHLHQEYLQWVAEIFPETPAAQLEHLKEEFAELCENPSDPGELADVLMLLLCVAKAHGVDIWKAFKNKFAINKARQWELTPKGYRHVKDAP